MNLFDLMATITLDTSNYDEGLDQSEEKAESFGSKVGKGLATAGKIGAAAVGAVAAGAVVLGTAVVKSTGQLAEYGDHIDKQSQKMGISAQAYQEWDAILQHSGTSIDSMSRGMQTLQRNAVNSADKFEALGITQEQLASMSTEELFSATITGLQNMGEGAERTALASELLGGSAKELGALLNTSAEDTEAMRRRVHELGGVMSDDAVKAAAAYQDSLQDMKTAVNGAKNILVGQFLPGVTSVMDGLTMLFSGDSASGIGQINEGISGIVGNISQALPGIISAGSQIILGIASAIVQNLPQLASAAVEIIPQLITGIVSMLPMLISTGASVILELISGLTTAIPELIAQAPVIITSLMTALIENIPMLLSSGISMIRELVDGIVEALPVLTAMAADLIIQLVNAIIENIPMLLVSGISMITELVDGIVEALPILIAMAPDLIIQLVNALIEAAPMLLQAGMELLTHIVNGLVTLAPKLLEAGKTLVLGLFDSLSTVVAKFSVIGQNLISNIKNGISATFSSLSGAVSTKFDSLKTKITSAFDGAYNGVKSVVEKLKTIFNFSWSLPKIKLPHFSVGPGPTVLGVSLPTINVDWYKKAYDNPYMFNSPTVVGAMGFGDGNGGEMVYGHESLMNDIREAVAQTMPRTIKLYLDGDKLVGGTSERMDGSLGQMQDYQLRWEGA